MDISIVCIGTELLIGHTLNTNLAFVGAALEAEGYVVAREICIPDQPAVMRDTLRRELEQADLVITVGGLGPTRDDLTRSVAAELLGLELRFDPQVHRQIVDFLSRRGVALRDEPIRRQAMVPLGATVLANRNGTAPGLWCPFAGKALVLLPGPPRELQPMFTDELLPRLRTMGPPEVCRRSLQVCGVPESLVEEQVDELLLSFPGLEPAYCARPSFVDVRLSGRPGQATELAAAVEALRAAFGAAALPAEQTDIVAAIGCLLLERGWKMATAESCTGGGLAAELTERPGASAWFAGAVVAYANEWKTLNLGVAEETLARHGAVSEETAREMALGLLARAGVQVGVSLTGIAGPEGGTPGKPVGLVYIGVAVPGGCRVHGRQFPGNRGNVRERAVSTALVLLRQALLEAPTA